MRDNTRVAVRDTPGLWRCSGTHCGTYVLVPVSADAYLYLWSTLGTTARGVLRWPEDVAPVLLKGGGA